MDRKDQPAALKYEVASDELSELAHMFDVSLRAAGRSPRTRQGYLEAIALLAAFLHNRGMPEEPHEITREHIEEFIAHERERPNPHNGAQLSTATVANRYRSLHVFFNYLVERGEISHSPMEKMHPPKIEQGPPDVITPNEIAALVKECGGRDFYSRRDLAMIAILLDTGARLQELAGMRTEGINWEEQTIAVTGKGARPRHVSFGDQAELLLRAYLRERRHHLLAAGEYLWIGRAGRLLPKSIYHILKARARAAGVTNIWVHKFRHSWAHYFLDAGGQERDLKKLGGWTQDIMVRWYGSSQDAKRAQRAHKDHSPANMLLGKDKKKGRD